jgi:tRNA A37 threonylcarbamoyladenosine modification protein TsaB
VLTLAIEIANPGTGGGGVALGVVRAGDPAATEVLGVEALREVDRDRDDLIPAVERLLRRAGHVMQDVQRVAVSVGPGGFTSTRVACATGAMLAEGLGVPAIAVPSALVAVEGGKRPVAVLMASKGAAVWCAVIPDNGKEAPAAARAGRMMTAPEIVSTGVTAVMADRHLPVEVRAVLEAAGVAIEPLAFTAQACLRASALCGSGDPSALVPIYPREPEAVTLWRQRHGDSRSKP